MMEFLHFWLRNILASWRLGYGIFAAVETISAIGAAVLRFRLRSHREHWEDVTMRAATILLLASFVISTVFVAPYVQYKDLFDKNKTRGDLRMSVIRYGYDRETRELSTDVQFVNNGITRRTVLAVVFTYRDSDNHPLVKSPDEIYGNGLPLYVEPGQPVVETYKRKLDDDSLTTKPGVAFGLSITTIPQNGKLLNFTSVEVMMVVTPFDNGITSLISISKSNVSLDIPGGYTSMEDPLVHLPRPAATPSPRAGPGTRRASF